jgi:hypothetical protein
MGCLVNFWHAVVEDVVKSGMEEGRWDKAPITYVKRIQPAKE